MKTVVILLFFSLSALTVYGQDTLRKRDGSVLLVKVKELTEDLIVYTLEDQPDGPVRKVLQSSVEEIVYANGTRERFGKEETVLPTLPKQDFDNLPPAHEDRIMEPGSINNTGHTVVIPRNGRDLKIRPGERFPNQADKSRDLSFNGKYLEGMMGYGYSSKLKALSNLGFEQPDEVLFGSNITLGIRFGSRFYLNKGEKARFGLHVGWLSFTGLLNSYGKGDVVFAPANIGLSAAFPLNDQSSLEINTLTGYAVSTLYRNNSGLHYGLAVKYRFLRLYTGFDFSRTSAIFGSRSEFANMLSFTLGAKL